MSEKTATIYIHYIFSLSSFRGRPEHLRDERQSEEQQESTDEEEAIVIVQLSNRVQDGTRCRPGSLDMCIQGKCQVGPKKCFQWTTSENLLRQMTFINIRYLISLVILTYFLLFCVSLFLCNFLIKIISEISCDNSWAPHTLLALTRLID